MTVFQAFILGLVQGVTEFLPISSSAHLVLVPWFFRWEDPGLGYDVFIHLGTLVAVTVYFAKDWWTLLRAGLASIIERRIGFERDRMLFWFLMLATIPGAISGMVFHTQAETIFRAPLLISVSLSLVGFIIYWIDGKYPTLKKLEEIKLKEALWIGIAQAFAIIPGVSRSGATMAMARGVGFNREAAAKFSFLLSLPIVFAAGVFKWRDFVGQGSVAPTAQLAVGFFSSAFFGLLSIHFLMRYLRVADFRIFVWYRVFLAFGIVVCSLAFHR